MLDWEKIFSRRPDLNPPGYEEACAAAKVKSQGRKHSSSRRKGKGRKGKFPSLKHGAQG